MLNYSRIFLSPKVGRFLHTATKLYLCNPIFSQATIVSIKKLLKIQNEMFPLNERHVLQQSAEFLKCILHPRFSMLSGRNFTQLATLSPTLPTGTYQPLRPRWRKRGPGVPIPDSCAQPNRHRPGSFLEIFLRWNSWQKTPVFCSMLFTVFLLADCKGNQTLLWF